MSLKNIDYCDTYYPTQEEFQNFQKYITKCQKSTKSGIFKIMPPPAWRPRKDNYEHLEFNIPFPIEQIVTGNSGVYEVFLIQRESRSLAKYKKLVESFDVLTDNKTPLEIEQLFWKNLKFSAPLYGADSPGTIFDEGVKWNLAELATILKPGLNYHDIMGVTSPYIYVGAWKTLFAWHKEDMDLYSINFNHLGKPKFWYSVPLEDNEKFEEFMKKTYPEASRDCSEFLRHKTYLVHPDILLKNGIRLHKCVQFPGEFVITMASGYHCGFNSGFNVAEAVNFALKSWIDLGKSAKSCKCRNDSVKINMDDFLLNLKNCRSIQTPPKKKKKEKIHNWIKCTNCSKWRVIPKSLFKKLQDFNCSMLKKHNCETPEGNWRKNTSTVRTKGQPRKIKNSIKKEGTVKAKKKLKKLLQKGE